MVRPQRRLRQTGRMATAMKKTASKPTEDLRPERWAKSAGNASIARLDIPADARRERQFEISVSMRVRALDGARAPWHELRVDADGQWQWSRRIATQHPAPFDSLDYRFRRSVPVGRALQLLATSDCGEARRLDLLIEADEI